MDTIVNELTRRKKAALNHHIRRDLVASTPKKQQEKAQAFSYMSCCAVKVGEKRQRNEYAAEICNTEKHGVEQNNRRESDDNGSDPKFNDFDKVREDANFGVGQTWALYDTADGMPRLYAQIRKVLAPSFGLRITYLEPDPVDEKELLWFEEDLPVSAGKFRLGKNENTKDRSRFSHLIQCNEGTNTGHFTISPRKGETWALFKNWDIKWSSEPDSHRKYEYEFVEVLSDYADRAGVFVAYLYRVPSFKLTGTEGKGVPKDAYELDQTALPETIEEFIVPQDSESNRKPKRQAIYFASKGKVFQTGQVWSFYSGNDELPLYYGMIQKITFTQASKQGPVFKLHINLLKALPFSQDIIQWVDKQMPITCGTFYARKVVQIISPDDVSHQIVPQTAIDGIQYTIFPKIGDVWAIYRHWTPDIDVDDLEESWHYDVIEVLDDALDYKVLLLEPDPFSSESVDTFFRAVKEYKSNPVDGSEPIFTIPKSELFRFSHHVPASRVTKEKHGDLEELYKVDHRAIPSNVLFEEDYF
ncbi:hypothetical protein EUTSA_v10015592mg [Eutrema salsugineum]|uniref:DUF3444 domain-containing protein n=1 Tax=Eutrema salsugineum TaxID=72664 RepID=V4N857_EUTSA|nr:hypothetical protein EUTSA_v10015592mg [Eutrema salsugineum]